MACVEKTAIYKSTDNREIACIVSQSPQKLFLMHIVTYCKLPGLVSKPTTVYIRKYHLLGKGIQSFPSFRPAAREGQRIQSALHLNGGRSIDDLFQVNLYKGNGTGSSGILIILLILFYEPRNNTTTIPTHVPTYNKFSLVQDKTKLMEFE